MVGFPLLLIPLAVYNIIVYLMPGVAFAEPLFTLPLPSGTGWPVTLGDILLTLGIFLLLLELIKGARPGAKYLIDHLLSLLICGAAIAEFLLWPRFANSTYFLLTLLALTEFFSGVALRTRRGRAATTSARRAPPPVPPLPPESNVLQPGPETPPPPAPAHTEPIEPAAQHDPVPVILEKQTVPPAVESSPAPSHPDDNPPRPSETPR